jgi:hypothetical protein
LVNGTGKLGALRTRTLFCLKFGFKSLIRLKVLFGNKFVRASTEELLGGKTRAMWGAGERPAAPLEEQLRLTNGVVRDLQKLHDQLVEHQAVVQNALSVTQTVQSIIKERMRQGFTVPPQVVGYEPASGQYSHYNGTHGNYQPFAHVDGTQRATSNYANSISTTMTNGPSISYQSHTGVQYPNPPHPSCYQPYVAESACMAVRQGSCIGGCPASTGYGQGEFSEQCQTQTQPAPQYPEATKTVIEIIEPNPSQVRQCILYATHALPLSQTQCNKSMVLNECLPNLPPVLQMDDFGYSNTCGDQEASDTDASPSPVPEPEDDALEGVGTEQPPPRKPRDPAVVLARAAQTMPMVEESAPAEKLADDTEDVETPHGSLQLRISNGNFHDGNAIVDDAGDAIDLGRLMAREIATRGENTSMPLCRKAPILFNPDDTITSIVGGEVHTGAAFPSEMAHSSNVHQLSTLPVPCRSLEQKLATQSQSPMSSVQRRRLRA